MSYPVPRPGLVIRYAFLWSHEAGSGKDEAAKDRPCAIVLSTRKDANGDTVVAVAPITHAPADEQGAAIELPDSVKRNLRLDDQPQWLRLDEVNRFVWPGYDLRPIPGRPGTFAYGMLPRALFLCLVRGILERNRVKRLSVRDRD